MRRFVFAFTTLLAPAALAADGPRLPAFALAGPFGDPFVLAVRRAPILAQDATGLVTPPAGERGGRAIAQGRAANPVAGSGVAAPKRKDDDEDDDTDDDPVPAKPGSFPTTFMKVPDPVPNQRKRTMGPHLRPDAEFDLDDRTTFGIISQLDRLHTTASQAIVGKSAAPTTSTRTLPGAATPHGRDLGFGASLEFKLGQ